MKSIGIVFLSGLLLLSNALSGQIPNQGFENWTLVGNNEMPDGWDNLNPVTDSTGLYTCTKGSPGSQGSYFINLTSTWIPGLSSVVPGIAVSGSLDYGTQQPASGFAFSERPEKLTGKWQYMSFGGDNGYIEVLLTKWNSAGNSRDTVAYKRHTLSGMVHNWTSFSITLDYRSDSYPDSCIIVLAASGLIPADFDFLWIDDLAFKGSVITSLPKTGFNKHDLLVYPNPATSSFRVRLNMAWPEKVQIIISDAIGNTLRKEDRLLTYGENLLLFNSEEMKPGVYFVTIRSTTAEEILKLLIR